MFESITRNMAGKVIGDNLDGLIRFAFFRLGDMVSAEDAVHDAVLKILDNPPSLLKAGNLKAYIYRAVYNNCMDIMRRNKLHEFVQLETVDINEGSDEEPDREEALRLYRLLKDIPEMESEIIRMNVIDELSFAEISRVLDIPVSTVKYRYKCGMSKMRAFMNNRKN